MHSDAADSIFVVVLTGGIASGKTAASDHFAQLGAPIIDTDVIARQVVQPGSAALQQIATAFGPDYIDASGNLDRQKMRNTIFTEPERKLQLEQILHPAIATQSLQEIEHCDAEWCILVVPLWAETGLFPWVNRVLVVDVEESVQIARVIARDGIDREQARAILAAQAPRQERLKLADDIIENNGTLEELENQVQHLFQTYSKLAAVKPSNEKSPEQESG